MFISNQDKVLQVMKHLKQDGVERSDIKQIAKLLPDLFEHQVRGALKKMVEGKKIKVIGKRKPTRRPGGHNVVRLSVYEMAA